MDDVVQAVISKDKQQRKVSLNSPTFVDSTEEEKKKAELGIYDTDIGSPLVRLMYDFFTDPHSSNMAYFWGQITAWLAILRVLEIAFESCDGPNQYVGRATDNSRYHFFLTDRQYWRLYIACMVPIIIDAVGKMVMLGFLFFAKENNALFYKLKQDGLERFLLMADILGIIPFLITAVYLRPYQVADNQAQNVVMTLLELLITARILRLIKNMPPIRSIRIALLNSVDHLVLPIFFFFTFNITAGVFLYFIEPCYNVDICPWQDLFESTFFSIVTMTTTGYGNQIPQYEFGRFVACCVMVFGALFLSMPLAIIGNEYESAWSNITEEIEKKRVAKEKADIEAAASLLRHERMINEQQNSKLMGLSGRSDSNLGLSNIDNKGTSETAGNAATAEHHPHIPTNIEVQAHIEEERKRKEYEAEKALLVSDPVIATQKTLFESMYIMRESCVAADFISPGLMLQYCEVQANLPTFTHALKNELAYLSRERLRHIAGLESLVSQNEGEDAKNASKRRMSLFHGKPDTAAPSAATIRNKQLLAIEEGSDDEPESTSKRRGATSSGAGGLITRTAVVPATTSSPTPSSAPASPRADVIIPASPVSPLRSVGAAATNADGTAVFARGRGSRITPETSAMGIGRGTVLIKNTAEGSSEKDSEPGTPSGSVKEGDTSSSGRRSMSARQTLFRLSVNTVASRNSMINRLKKLVGNKAIEELRDRTGSADFDHQARMLTSDPTSWKTRLWILLELPNSSKEAKTLQIILIFLISFSIFILYTQTSVNLTQYGESTTVCGKVVQIYCDDKFDNSLDPGCYVHFPNGTVTDQHLSFGCDDGDDCFRRGTNFGAPGSNVTCLNEETPPFQDMAALDYTYGKPYLFSSRYKMNHISPICTRIECMDNSDQFSDAQFLWVLIEFVINITFTIELSLRILVSKGILIFFYDYLNVFDVLSVVPFYVELVKTLAFKGFDSLNFGILASSPDQLFFVTMRSLKVFRMFKLTRHFNASKVITATAKRAYKQILGMISFLVFLVILFAILLYQVESGRSCYVGDVDCHPPPDAPGLHIGDRIRINKNGDLSSFSNVFYGLWYSFVTLTSTGYGDIVAVTNAGQVMSIILMLMGSFYLSMPLTAAASTFYNVHQIYNEKKAKSEIQDKPPPPAENKTPFAGLAAPTPPPVPVNAPAIIYGDHLDKKLERRINMLLAELVITQGKLQDFYQDLHKTATEFDVDSDPGKLGDVVVNNRKIPTLKMRSAAAGGAGSGSSSKGRRGSGGKDAKSALLQQMQELLGKLESALTQSEEDILRVVVLHHKIRKNF